jgi:hypothetical protein
MAKTEIKKPMTKEDALKEALALIEKNY